MARKVTNHEILIDYRIGEQNIECLIMKTQKGAAKASLPIHNNSHISKFNR